MSDSLNAAAQALQAKIDEAGFDGSVKFDMEGAGVIRIVDGARSRPTTAMPSARSLRPPTRSRSCSTGDLDPDCGLHDRQDQDRR